MAERKPAILTDEDKELFMVFNRGRSLQNALIKQAEVWPDLPDGHWKLRLLDKAIYSFLTDLIDLKWGDVGKTIIKDPFSVDVGSEILKTYRFGR